MEKKKFDFKDIKGMLSRDEMKQIKGGSGGFCITSLDCSGNRPCCHPSNHYCMTCN